MADDLETGTLAETRSEAGTDRATVDQGATRPDSPELDTGRSTARGRLPRGVLVGRYVTLHPLGAGAMGVVVAAYDPELDRKVALKLLANEAAPTSTAQARLQREAQALAKLSHPNVVTVHDVGTHEGQVFVAMELVEGQTLREWMHREGEGARGWREVVPVFVGAGRGLAAAHERGVVHRDFKPANVMIDGRGRVRVMDFGLARAWAEHLHELGERRAAGGAALSLTATGSIMGTPAYMSPEQFDDAHVGPASDQFSYCVALYEALCGDRPFEGRDVGSLAEAIGAGQVRPMPRAVPGWLQAVVLRGLHPAPGDRFADMDALLAALEAGGLRRQRRTVAAAVGLLAVLVGGVAVAAAWQRSAEEARCVAEGAVVDELWDARARAKVAEALAVSGLDDHEAVRTRLWPWIDRAVASWREARVEACRAHHITERLDEARYARASWCLADRKQELAATLQGFERLDVPGALQALPSVLALASPQTCIEPTVLGNLPDPPPASMREQAEALGREHARLVAAFRGDQTQTLEQPARDLVRDAAALGWPPLEASAHAILGEILLRTGDLEEGARALELAYATAATSGDWGRAADAASLLIFAVANRLNRVREGETWAVHAEVAIAQAGDPNGLREARRLDLLGGARRVAGKFDSAAELHAEALARYEAVYGVDHPSTVRSMTNLAGVYVSLERFDESLALLDRAIAIRAAHLGPHHPAVGTALATSAACLLRTGDNEEAAARLRRALGALESAYGPQNPEVAGVYTNLGVALSALGDVDGARKSQRKALEIWQAIEGKQSPRAAAVMVNLGVELKDEGKHDQARELFEQALASFVAVYGAQHPMVGQVRTTLAEMEFDLGRHAVAAQHAEAALEAYAGVESPGVNELFARFTLARALDALGRDSARVLELARGAREDFAAYQDDEYVELADELIVRHLSP